MSDLWNVHDPLGEALHALRMNQSTFYLTEFTAPWGLAMPAGCTNFYLVLEGELELTVAAPDRIPLSTGDLALVLHGAPYRFASDVEAPDRRPDELEEQCLSPRLRLLRQGGGGALTRFFCGALRFDSPLAYELIRHLPKGLVVRAGDASTRAHLLALTQLIEAEAAAMRPGWETVCTRLADILVIQALRGWFADQPETGWLGALRDPRLSRAIVAMHREPARPWSLAELAREAVMSRSAFAERFRSQLGEAPMQYLTRARMLQALARLRDSDAGISELAAEAGYSSEAAFHRAFRRSTGLTPGAARRIRKVDN